MSHDIEDQLLKYVRAVLGERQARYLNPPVRFGAGVENRVFGLQFGDAPTLEGPLVLKVFAPYVEPRRARCEAIVQNELASQGFPAPRVLHICEEPEPFGAPFLIMERLPGETPLAPLASVNPSRLTAVLLMRQAVVSMPRQIAALLIRLHQLDPGPLRERLRAEGLLDDVLGVEARLRKLRADIGRHELSDFDDLADWLAAKRPADVEPKVVCHGDIWFGNVLAADSQVTGLVDWSSELFSLGDPMYDLGVSVAIVKCGVPDLPILLRAVVRRLQHYVSRRIVREYARGRPVDTDRLGYYEVLRSVEFVSWVAIRRVDPTMRTRAKGEDMLEVPGSVDEYLRLIRARTGIPVAMPEPVSRDPSRL